MAIYLSLKGIDGGSTRKEFLKQIELTSAQYGIHRSGTSRSGTGGSGGEASVSEMTCSRRTDKASPTLFQKLAEGAQFPEAVITFTKSKAGGGIIPFVVYTMKDVYISSFQISGQGESGDNVTPFENLSLSFKKIKFEYTDQADDNTTGSTVTGEWSVAESA